MRALPASIAFALAFGLVGSAAAQSGFAPLTPPTPPPAAPPVSPATVTTKADTETEGTNWYREQPGDPKPKLLSLHPLVATFDAFAFVGGPVRGTGGLLRANFAIVSSFGLDVGVYAPGLYGYFGFDFGRYLTGIKIYSQGDLGVRIVIPYVDVGLMPGGGGQVTALFETSVSGVRVTDTKRQLLAELRPTLSAFVSGESHMEPAFAAGAQLSVGYMFAFGTVDDTPKKTRSQLDDEADDRDREQDRVRDRSRDRDRDRTRDRDRNRDRDREDDPEGDSHRSSGDDRSRSGGSY